MVTGEPDFQRKETESNSKALSMVTVSLGRRRAFVICCAANAPDIYHNHTWIRDRGSGQAANCGELLRCLIILVGKLQLQFLREEGMMFGGLLHNSGPNPNSQGC